MASMQSVEKRLRKYDSSLKLKDSGGPYIELWRKDREGRYQKLGQAFKHELGDGGAWIATLKKNDMWEAGGASKFMDEMDEDRRVGDRTRKRKRKQEFIDQGREQRDIIHRLNKYRINNAGLP